MKYKAVFIDIDDTILNYKQCSKEALKNTFKYFDEHFNDEIYEKYFEIDCSLWAKQKQGLIAFETVINLRFKYLLDFLEINLNYNKFSDIFHNKLAETHYLELNAMEIITYLSKKYKLYAVSNGNLLMQTKRLKLAGLYDYFSDLFVSNDIGFEKPNRCFFTECFVRSGLKNDDIFIIGDSLETDITGAKNSNIKACWYNPERKINYTNVCPDNEINNWLDLKIII